MVDTLILGKGYNAFGGGYVVGQFNLGAGTLNVNTLQLGVVSSSTATAAHVTGILNVIGGTVVVNNQLVLGLPVGPNTVQVAAGALNITNGMVQASAIIAGGSTNSSIALSGGTLSLTSPAGPIGTAAAPVGSITLDSGTTLNLAVGGFPAVVANGLVASGSTDTVNLITLPLIPHVPTTNTIIQSLGGPISGYDFVLGSPLPTGYKGYIQPSADGSAVELVITNAPFPLKGVTITSARAQSGSIVMSGTNGLANGVYYVLSSTNLAAPMAIRWTSIATNAFDVNGDFIITLPAGNGQEFFKIESQ